MSGDALRVYILCGLPFSGKSTLARALAERLDLESVEVDRAMRDIVGPPSGEPIPREAWIAAYRISYRAMEAALGAGRSVVLDATNYRRLHRDLIRAKAARLGATAVVITVDTPEATIRERRERNRLTRSRPDVAEADFRLVQDGMQPPGPDEATVHVVPDMGIDELIAAVDAIGG